MGRFTHLPLTLKCLPITLPLLPIRPTMTVPPRLRLMQRMPNSSRMTSGVSMSMLRTWLSGLTTLIPLIGPRFPALKGRVVAFEMSALSLVSLVSVLIVFGLKRAGLRRLFARCCSLGRHHIDGSCPRSAKRRCQASDGVLIHVLYRI